MDQNNQRYQPEIAAQEPPVSVDALLDQGNLLLAAGEWKQADGIFELVLYRAPNHPIAYLGKLLAESRCSDFDAFVQTRKRALSGLQGETRYIRPAAAHKEAVIRKYVIQNYASEQYIETLFGAISIPYTCRAEVLRKQIALEQDYWSSQPMLTLAMAYGDSELVKQLSDYQEEVLGEIRRQISEAELSDGDLLNKARQELSARMKEADRKAEANYNRGVALRLGDYGKWQHQAASETNPERLQELSQNFLSLGDFRDSRELADRCRKRLAAIRAQNAQAASQRPAAQSGGAAAGGSSAAAPQKPASAPPKPTPEPAPQKPVEYGKVTFVVKDSLNPLAVANGYRYRFAVKPSDRPVETVAAVDVVAGKGDVAVTRQLPVGRYRVELSILEKNRDVRLTPYDGMLFDAGCLVVVTSAQPRKVIARRSTVGSQKPLLVE